MKLTRRHVFITGRVQGVGFRWSACARACELGLTGWVRNLPDSGVELCFQGEQGAVEQMEDWCRVGTPYSRVTGVSISEDALVANETDFEIR